MRHWRFFFTLVCLTGTWAMAQVNCLDVRSFGVIVNGTGDNSDSLQRAINQAALAGNTLCFPAGIYRFSKPLTIPAGVIFKGAGMGSNATSTPYNGTLLWYTGDSVALSIIGTNVSLSDLTLYNYGATAQKGIKISAEGQLVESVQLSRVQIYGFTSGTALLLRAANSGGISYCSFYDCRVRHGKTGIEIREADASSFVNSNTFFHGVVSGGGFDYALLVNGGNNNVFFSTVIEPPSSQLGHVVVNKGQIIGQQIRIEAVQQSNGVPVLKFGSNANQSRLTGFYAGGMIRNDGNNVIELASSNTIGEQNSNGNLLLNSAFVLLGINNVPEFWTVSNANARLTQNTDDILVGQRSLNLKVPSGQSTDFYPKPETAPKLSAYVNYDYANFSVLAKTSMANKVKLTYNYAGGVVSSVSHSGSGQWETIGLQALTNTSNAPAPKIVIDNTTGSDTLSVDLSGPAFCFGQNVPSRDPTYLTTAGGVVSGLLSTSVSTQYSFIAGTNYLVLPKSANLFIINTTGTTIARINHLTADRIPKGAVITLLMNASGIVVQNSAYIALKSSFSSTAANTSLTLMSNGDGTWREVNRNN